ncbi:unnamed protein product [Rotaria sp. Silwood2]|nr:unnamed protein product [Rotaria sp. Silwood2]
MCDIKYLSSSIAPKHIIKNLTNEIRIQNLLSSLIPYIQLLIKSLTEKLLYDKEENILEIFVKYRNFDLDLKDSNNIPWYMPSKLKQIKHIEPNTDEQWINEYLHAKYHDKIQLNDIEIIGLNEKLKQRKPYNFILKNLKTNTITYIEVKNTLSNNRQLIPITYNELQYCYSLSDINQHFQIYHVYNTDQFLLLVQYEPIELLHDIERGLSSIIELRSYVYDKQTNITRDEFNDLLMYNNMIIIRTRQISSKIITRPKQLTLIIEYEYEEQISQSYRFCQQQFISYLAYKTMLPSSIPPG